MAWLQALLPHTAMVGERELILYALEVSMTDVPIFARTQRAERQHRIAKEKGR